MRPTAEDPAGAQEIWSGAAVALGFAGVNLYMLADRENWEFSPLTADGERSPFFSPVERLTALHEAGGVGHPVAPPVQVLWHRPDAFDAYSVTGTARDPEVDWYDPEMAAPYAAWDATLLELTRRGIVYDLWDTAVAPAPNEDRPLIVPEGSGVDPAVLSALRSAGRVVLHVGPRSGWDALRRLRPRVTLADGRPAESTLATRREGLAGGVLHLVHWGAGGHEVRVRLDGIGDGSVTSLRDSERYSLTGGSVTIPLRPGHHVFRLPRG